MCETNSFGPINISLCIILAIFLILLVQELDDISVMMCATDIAENKLDLHSNS